MNENDRAVGPLDVSSIASDQILRRFLVCALDVRIGGQDAWTRQSKIERLAVALAMNRADWLQLEGMSIAAAIERIGPGWAAHLSLVERQMRALDKG